MLKEPEADVHDKTYSISVSEQGVFLTVFPAKQEGQLVNQAQVVDELKKRQIEKYDYSALLTALREAKGEQVKIAEPPAPVEEPEVQVLVSRDRMEATLQIVKPQNSRPVTMEEVMAKIQKSGITFGVDTNSIQQAFERPGLQVACAKGQPPVEGKNAQIKYYVDFEAKGRPVELEDGRVDFKNLNIFTLVNQGDLLAEKIAPTAGNPGTDILGNSLSAKPGKDTTLPIGKNVEVADATKLIASIAGQVTMVNKKISVSPVIEINGDVDLSTGNIDFVGNVIVRGSVQAGFSIKAQGNVEVYGAVSGGTIEAKNVVVKTGIQGMHRGYVKAEENILTKFIENANVHAGKDITVGEVILHSNVNAGKKVLVQGKRALIAGGKVVAGEEIQAKAAGTQMATNTELEVGINPMLREEFNTIRKEIKKMEANLDQTQKALNILKAMNPTSLPPDKREMLLKLTKAQFHLVGQVEGKKNRLAEIDLAFEEMKHGRVRIQETVFPGVKIVVGSIIKPVREPLSYSSFYEEDGEIKVGPFN